MAENSKIEWTDHTFNPWVGCTKVSAACDHCYAEVSTPARVMRASGNETWGPHAPRQRTSAANWKKPHQWNAKAKAEGRRYRVFCASLADVFDNHASILSEWRADLWALIHTTPHLDWLLVTKRPQNIGRMMPNYLHTQRAWPNVWLGTTVENQTEADRRIPRLLSSPAAVRFLSVEPMLGPVDLRFWIGSHPQIPGASTHIDRNGDERQDIGGGLVETLDWVICGGESGPGARPMHPDWARSLRDQCVAAGVPFHFKQHGEFVQASYDVCPDSDMSRNKAMWLGWDGKQAKPYHTGLDRPVGVIRIGKKAAGRKLDGRTWDELPGAVNG